EEAEAALNALSAGERHPALLREGPPIGSDARLVFFLSGGGLLTPGMLSGLDAQFAPVLHATVANLTDTLAATRGADIRSLLFDRPSAAASQALSDPAISNAVHFIGAVALARQFEAWSHRPAAFLGHGLGEVAVAALAGMLPDAEALECVIALGEAEAAGPPETRLFVALDAEKIAPYLGAECWLAEENAAEACVVAGPPEEISQMEARFKEAGVLCRAALGAAVPLRSSVRQSARVTFSAPDRPVFLSSLGREFGAEDVGNGPPQAQIGCAPARLRDALEALSETPHLALEIGVGNGLGPAITAALGDGHHLASLPLATEEKPARHMILTTLAALWLAHRETDWGALQGVPLPLKVALPDYPFNRRRFWSLPQEGGQPKEGADRAKTARVPAPPTGPEISRQVWLRRRRAHKGAQARPEPEHCAVYDPLHNASSWRDVLAGAAIASVEEAKTLLIPGAQHAGQLDGLMRALVDLGATAPKAERAIILTRAAFDVLGNERLVPSAAATQALVLSAAQELGRVAIHGLDLDGGDRQGGFEGALAALLQDGAPRRAALRMGSLWISQVDPLEAPFEAPQEATLGGQRRALSGHVLLTGASGQFGRALTGALTQIGGLKLSLLARGGVESPPLGALSLAADICDPEALARALATAQSHHGPVDHVIAAAGPSAGASYRAIEAGWADEIAAVKWRGFETLLAALAAQPPLKSGVLISSLSTVLGGLGLASYAAANGAAEALARMAGPGWSSLALDGLGDGEGGLALASAAAQCVDLLAQPTGDITYMSATPLDARLRKWVTPAMAERAGKAEPARRDAPGSPGSLGSPGPQAIAPADLRALSGPALRDAVAEIWADLLGAPADSHETDFFAAGGDSLLLVQLLPRLSTLSDVDVTLSEIIDEATIEGMAALLERAAEPSPADEDEMEEGEL
ncbi:MAG: KR domain-containing protein, partial [Pseudomonadota bacterium]